LSYYGPLFVNLIHQYALYTNFEIKLLVYEYFKMVKYHLNMANAIYLLAVACFFNYENFLHLAYKCVRE